MKKSRREKRENKDKFIVEHTKPRLEAKTKNQQLALNALYDPNIRLVIMPGPAGVGKSYLTGSVAAELFEDKKISQIIVARPYVQTGRTSGFKPGTSLEKLYPYVRTILDPIEKRLGRGQYECNLKDGLKGNIQVQEVESIRGRSFDEPSILMIDEAQQTIPAEMESIITRVGEDCKLVVCGDIRQKDIKGESGLEWLLKFIERHRIPDVAIIDFTIEDCVRSGFVKDILHGLNKDLNK